MNARTVTIANATMDALMYFFDQNLAPSRKMIVNWIKDRKGELNSDSRLDLSVARRLNFFVETGALRIIEGDLYVSCKGITWD